MVPFIMKKQLRSFQLFKALNVLPVNGPIPGEDRVDFFFRSATEPRLLN